jgi:hypothetical protein
MTWAIMPNVRHKQDSPQINIFHNCTHHFFFDFNKFCKFNTCLSGNKGADLLTNLTSDLQSPWLSLLCCLLSWQDEHRLRQPTTSDESVHTGVTFLPQLHQCWEGYITWCRIHRTHLTCGHPLRSDPAPVCNHCDVPLTIWHTLQEYPPCDIEEVMEGFGTCSLLPESVSILPWW